MQSVVTNAMADPTSLLDFDPCKEFPNKEIKTTTNDLGQTVNEAVQKAKTIEIPTINPVEISESAAPVQTVVSHQEIQDADPPTDPKQHKIENLGANHDSAIFSHAGSFV